MIATNSGTSVVGAELADPNYLPLLASSAAHKKVGLAPPDGSADARPAIVIVGLDELVALLAA